MFVTLTKTNYIKNRDFILVINHLIRVFLKPFNLHHKYLYISLQCILIMVNNSENNHSIEINLIVESIQPRFIVT